MTGFDDPRETGEWGVDRTFEDAIWVREVPYVKGWAEARDAAMAWNNAVEEAGLRSVDLKAVASTGAGGVPVVRLRATVEGIRTVTELLRLGGRSLGARRWVR